MTFRVYVISKDTIKPSSATPRHRRHFKLSLLDQYAIPVPVPLLLFYKTDNQDVKLKLDRLKMTLSKSLTDFYPLAGRINGNKYIDCNDDGVNFFEAHASVQLSQVLKNPVPHELVQLLPVDNFFGSDPKPLLSIQANIFDCGGLALGMYISHKFGDASSFSLYLNNWASISRGDSNSNIVRPRFDSASMFPPSDHLPSFTPPSEIPQKIISKRFIFEASGIAALKAKSSGTTRVEAVTSLIWRCAMKAARMRTESVKRSSTVMLLVNLRGKLNPPLSNLSVGNLFTSTLAMSPTEVLPELESFTGELHRAISKIDHIYVRDLQFGEGIVIAYDTVKEAYEQSARGETDFYAISSWCRIPFYDADFGTGKPVWIGGLGSVNVFLRNAVNLLDTSDGKGIEAWVGLTEEDMRRFECDPELLIFTSSNNNVS